VTHLGERLDILSSSESSTEIMRRPTENRTFIDGNYAFECVPLDMVVEGALHGVGA
jgi:hypothetical protein